MSKLLIAQVAFMIVLAVGAFALGAEIFAGHMDPDVILPWAYVAAFGWFGAGGVFDPPAGPLVQE